MVIKVTKKIENIRPDRIVTVSNIISITRAFLTIPIIYCLKKDYGTLAFVFIVIAILSDMLDGWLARISHEITDIGKIVDPVADGIVVLGVMLFLLIDDIIPLFYFIILLIRNLNISILGIYMINHQKISLGANKMGKVSIIFTVATVLAFIYNIEQLKYPTLWVSIVFMSISWIQYNKQFILQIRLKEKVNS